MERKWGACDKAKVGCAFCCGNCLTALRDHAHELSVFREELAALPSEVQDVHLPWIFYNPTNAHLPKAK